MSWWKARYKNNHGEYEITFGSKYYEKTKAVERFCQAIIDKKLDSEIAADVLGRLIKMKQGRWKGEGMGDYSCSLCTEIVSGNEYNYCPNCGTKMDLEDDDA